jgi:hypothetical protein
MNLTDLQGLLRTRKHCLSAVGPNTPFDDFIGTTLAEVGKLPSNTPDVVQIHPVSDYVIKILVDNGAISVSAEGIINIDRGDGVWFQLSPQPC